MPATTTKAATRAQVFTVEALEACGWTVTRQNGEIHATNKLGDLTGFVTGQGTVVTTGGRKLTQAHFRRQMRKAR